MQLDGRFVPASNNRLGLDNPLQLVAAPFLAENPCRQRFLFRGDATKPITGITVTGDISSRYQIPANPSLAIACPFRLKILHFNDLHGRISHVGKQEKSPVFSRIVTRYQHLQRQYGDRQDAGVLLLSAGDDMVGTPFDILMAEQSHPYDLYQALGVDVAALGNHDLDLGIQTLAKIVRRSPQFPLLSANLHVPAALQPYVYPAALVDAKGVRVGIIGLTTSAQMKSAEARQLRFADPVAVVKNLLPVLRPYCHVLIILSHLGYDLHATSARMEGYGDRQLAEQLPYGAVDLIIGGHTHHVLNEAGLSPKNIVNGIPIAQAGAMGRFLGEVTITLSDPHHATVTNAKLTVTSDLPTDGQFEKENITPIVAALEAKLNQPLGTVTPHPDLEMDAVLNDFASRELAIANFITAGMLAQVRKQGFVADLAMTDAAVLQTGLPLHQTTLRYADWFAVMPYADTLTLYQFTGKELLQFLLDNARRANRRREPHLERGFVQFSEQLRYHIHLGKNRLATAVENIHIGDRPLESQLEQTFTIVSHSFLRQLAHPWEAIAQQQGIPVMNLEALPTKDTGLFIRESLVDYIQTQGGVLESGGAKRDDRLIIAP